MAPIPAIINNYLAVIALVSKATSKSIKYCPIQLLYSAVEWRANGFWRTDMNRLALLIAVCLTMIAPTSHLPAQQATQVPANAVILCENPDFVPPCVQVDWDPATRHKLVRQSSTLGFEISSIAVGKDVEVWVFCQTNYFGTSAVIKTNRSTLKKIKGNEFYPYPWSIERRAHSYIVSSDGFFPWSEVKKPTGAYPQDWDDQIESFIIYPRGKEPEGVLLLMDRHEIPLEISPYYNDQTSLFCPMPEDRKRESEDYSLHFLPHGHFERDARMIRVPPAVSVVLFEQRKCVGDRLELPGVVAGATANPELITTAWKGEWDPFALKSSYPHWFDLKNYGFDYKVSSVRVRIRDWLHAPERDSHDTDTPKHRAPPANPTPQVMAVEALPVDPNASPMIEGRQLEMAPSSSLSLEPDANRPGHDYKNFMMNQADAEICRAACEAEAKCQAFTYVKPGIQEAKARCWLKDKAAPAQPAPCCISGARTTGN